MYPVSRESGARFAGHQAGSRGHSVAWTAWRMTRVTTDGSEMRDRCPALTSVMWAPARLAMNVSSAGGMTWSPVPITAQDGMPFQAGGPGRLGERAGRERPLAGCDDRGLAGGQAGSEASGNQIRLDVEVDVTRRCAGVGHGDEHLGGISQAGSGLRAGEAADGIALVGYEGIHVHQGLALGGADRGVGDDRPAVGVPDQNDRVPLDRKSVV